MNVDIRDTCLYCSTLGGCPFSFTDESEKIQNYGCLPTPYEILEMRIYFGKTWACHSNTTKPCLGAINFLKKKQLPYKVTDNVLVTEKDDWGKYLFKDNNMNYIQEKDFLTRYIRSTNDWWNKVAPHLIEEHYNKLKASPERDGLITVRSESDKMIATVNSEDIDITYAVNNYKNK